MSWMEREREERREKDWMDRRSHPDHGESASIPSPPLLLSVDQTGRGTMVREDADARRASKRTNPLPTNQTRRRQAELDQGCFDLVSQSKDGMVWERVSGLAPEETQWSSSPGSEHGIPKRPHYHKSALSKAQHAMQAFKQASKQARRA